MEWVRYIPVGHQAVGVESGERCVEPHQARDCARDSWALGVACPHLFIMSKISRDLGEGPGLRQVELP